jgi:hypothetical protein
VSIRGCPEVSPKSAPATGLVLDMLCYRGIDTPALLLQRSQCFAIRILLLALTFFKKRRNFGDVLP